jgi:hypothetical protein
VTLSESFSMRRVEHSKWFQQDGTPAHYTVQYETEWMNSFLSKWLEGSGLVEWPSWSPDLTLLPVGPSRSRVKANDEEVCNTEPPEEWTVTACSELAPQIIHTIHLGKDNIFVSLLCEWYPVQIFEQMFQTPVVPMVPDYLCKLHLGKHLCLSFLILEGPLV